MIQHVHGGVVKTSPNCLKSLVLLTASSGDEYCRVTLTPEQALSVASALVAAAKEINPYVGSNTVVGEETVSEPGAAITVKKLHLSDAAKNGLSTSGDLAKD